MADDIAHVELADAATARQLDQLPAGRRELKGRLERLDGTHPSSLRYAAADIERPDGGDVLSEGAARSETDGEHADRAEADRADAGGADGGDADGCGAETGRDAADASRESGWQALGVRDHPNRPDPDEMHLQGDRAQHILAGDGPDSLSGGHRHGTGIPGKTEFPERWSDDMIVSTVQDVARDPDGVDWQVNKLWNVRGERDRVEVRPIVRPDGRIWTAWPGPGGAGVIKNPGGVR